MTENRRNRNLDQLLRSPGRLCANPTDLSADYPHGGTDLGNIRACATRPVQRAYRVTAEEWGGRMVEQTHLGRGEIISVIFRGMNEAAIEHSYPNSEAGGTTGRRMIFSPAPGDDDANRPGTRHSGRALTLFFAPDDDTSPTAVLIQKGLPMLEESMELALQANVDVEHAVVFEAIPMTANARPWQVGRRQDLTLGAEAGGGGE